MGSDIQDAAYQFSLRRINSDNWDHLIHFRRPDHMYHVLQIQGRMFHIEHHEIDPVEAQDLHQIGIA